MEQLALNAYGLKAQVAQGLQRFVLSCVHTNALEKLIERPRKSSHTFFHGLPRSGIVVVAIQTLYDRLRFFGVARR